jgi:hypothetical protein
MSLPSASIPYGPDHRKQLATFCGLDDIVTYLGSKDCLRVLGRDSLCGITSESFQLPDGRVLVTRQDRYTCYTQATIWPDRATWSQWWHTDRLRGEKDPETGRPFAGR